MGVRRDIIKPRGWRRFTWRGTLSRFDEGGMSSLFVSVNYGLVPRSLHRVETALRADRLLLGSDDRHQWTKWMSDQAREDLKKNAAQSLLHTNAQRLLRL